MGVFLRVKLFVILFLITLSVESANWVRNSGIAEKEYKEGLVSIGALKEAPNYNDCKNTGGLDGITIDHMLVFDISEISRLIGNVFDVNKLYVDSIEDEKVALRKWLDNWEQKSGKRELALLYGNNLENQKVVSICVGWWVWASSWVTNASLESIFLWYDGPIALPAPDPENPNPPLPPSDLPNLVTAGTSSSAPNLSATVVIEKHDQSEDTNQQVPLGDLYCGIQTKNTTNVKMESFQNKCTLYDGLKAGNDSPESLGSKTVSSLSGGSKTTTHHSFTLKDPSYYTLYGCANTGTSPPKETETSDNCGTRTFLAYGVPDVKVEEVYVQGGATVFSPGNSFTVVADVGNSGDNFHAGKNRKMTIAAELSGCVPKQTVDAVEIDDSVLHHGDSGKTKTFTVTIPPTATPGICTVTIIADPDGELQQEPNRETNRSNNSKAITISVSQPQPPTPAPPVISVTSVTLSNGTSHVYTDEKVDVSIGVKNSGGSVSSPMTGRIFMTPIAGGQDTTIGTFSLDAIPAGGTTTGVIPGVFFSVNGEMTLTVCFGEGNANCWDGGKIFIEVRDSSAIDEEIDAEAIRMLMGM